MQKLSNTCLKQTIYLYQVVLISAHLPRQMRYIRKLHQMQKDKLEELASERSYPCVTISMNTHRTFPNNQKDVIEFQKLLKEAHEHVVN
ncbi:MAG TPA: hypothetical protein DCR40_19650 [Prolixibacteraceae bacterium]|nr:hypothetical protein [Prolixibacteraceae bacterium]